MFETERLFLRPMNDGDVDAIYVLRNDAEMMRYIREPQNSRADVANWVNLVSSRWQTERIGLCAVLDRASNQLIGWCGLWRLPESGEIEVGYAIAVDFQSKGLASEAAARCLKYGFEELNLDKIVAVARPENVASCRVMEKIGMTYDGIGRFYDRDLAHYSILKKDFGK
ncbi:MAG: GNAT family N-acetyltransferase [Acidobacteriota bacterium]|nr:GNAT family N-acetyltransferase [Acidobacteriota bacterium]